MAANDDIDTESLQAQIDLAMSFAHNLVTSWIKPIHLPQLRSSGVDATQILEEELRRPPRLGVGAPTPTVPPLSHVASKLKRRLGKNRASHESAMELKPQDSLKSDDEEHKGRPTKRKTKIDPFGHEGSKKKRKDEPTSNPYSTVEKVSANPVSLLKDPAFGEPQKHDSSSETDKQHMGLGNQQFHVIEGRSTTSVSSLAELPALATFPQGLAAQTIPNSFVKPSRRTSVPVPEDPTAPQSSTVYTNPMVIPDKAKLFGIPLLNLDGPPECAGKSSDTNDSRKTRKKRKKRKRKKTQMIASTGNN